MNDLNTDWQLECTGIRNRGAHILKTGEFSDCTFTVSSEQDQVTLSAHKIILAMASPVFRAMFYGNFTENGAGISVIDIEADVFKSLLVYIYTDEVEVRSFGKAIELYYAAKKYMLPHLAKECVAYLSSNLCAENALVVYEFAAFNDNQDLVDKSTKVICEQAKDVLKANSFTEASLETVCMMFSMDPLNIDSELDLLAAAKRYLEANNECTVSPARNHSLTAYEQHKTTPSEINELSTFLNTKLGDVKARPNARFQFTVQNIGTLQGYVQSPPYYIRNLPWTIKVGPENRLGPNGQNQKMLGIYIQCNAESESTCWSCYAAYSLRIVCHKLDSERICTNSRALFHSKQNCFLQSAIISWNDVLDPAKGYIKDGSIIVKACVKAEAPHKVSGETENNTSSVVTDHNDKLTIRHAVRLIRFLTLTAEQFADGAANSALLDKAEESAIFINLVSKKPHVSMPLDFCKLTKKRQKKITPSVANPSDINKQTILDVLIQNNPALAAEEDLFRFFLKNT